MEQIKLPSYSKKEKKLEGKSRCEDEALRAHSFFSFKMKFLLSADDNKERFIYLIHTDLLHLKTAAVYFLTETEMFVPSSPSTFSMEPFLSTLKKLLYGNKHKRFRFQLHSVFGLP